MYKALQDFLRLESAGGLVLMAASVVAMIVANSPLAPQYLAALQVPFAISVGDIGLAKPIYLWVNDGLMAVFFFLVGMELKREIVEGHLSSLRAAALPGIAAIGGMALPALFYSVIAGADPVAMRGWAIPAATDIAFALGVLSLIRPKVPTALKALLLSIAIFDDLGAVVIIALFYTAELSTTALVWAGVCVAGLAALNRAGVTRPAAYLLIGIPLWIAVLKSGVHATLAGVVAAMAIPMVSRREDKHSVHSPLHDLEHALHPWVAFGVLPVFALVNAGVPLNGLSLTDLAQPVPLGIMAGLFLGKQIGVLGFSWLAVRMRVAALPGDVSWAQVYGVSLLCGIGFTMSLFVASLAFPAGAFQGLERLGILMGSLVAGLAGYGVLRLRS